MRLNKQIFGWLGATALLMTTACTNDTLAPEVPGADANEVVYGNGNSIVTLNITPDTYTGTRSISDGTQAKSLYFEVYEVTAKTDEIKAEDTSASQEATPVLVSIISNDKALTVNDDMKATIKVAVDPDKKYRIALWACNAAQMNGKNETDKVFTITGSPLNVAVDYSKVTNNYEAMDAFCATQYFEGGDKKVSVILHRPFAQLNIGTTGADYKNYQEGNIYPNATVTYSKVVVKGISKSIDVANDKIANEEQNAIEFKFAKTIAEQKTGASNTEEYLKVKLNNSATNKIVWTTDEEEDDEDKWESVELGSNNFFGFRAKYPTIKTKGDYAKAYDKDGDVNVKQGNTLYLTEEFKYLSMCYVLVPSPSTANPDFEGDGLLNPGSNNNYYDPYHSHTLTSVDVYFAETSGDTHTDGHKYFTVTNVPAHRNWRTNLLGGLADTTGPNDPNDPDGPDDPSSLFYNVEVAVNICPIYFGEYNGNNAFDKDKYEDHYFGINGGWFPTGSDDLHDDFGTHPKKPAASSGE